jgi:hypothetical protein
MDTTEIDGGMEKKRRGARLERTPLFYEIKGIYGYELSDNEQNEWIDLYVKGCHKALMPVVQRRKSQLAIIRACGLMHQL